MRVVSGIQASGNIHLGNYFGAIQQFLKLQQQHELLCFVADLHALTSVRNGTQLRTYGLELATDLLALGIDPKQSALFVQSHVPYHAELAWILQTITPMALLERAHSYKDKLANGIAPDVGLFTYPVLMAADILLYGAEGVPVGQDQKQHLEITRDIATKFNRLYVPDYLPEFPLGSAQSPPGLLRLPEPMIYPDVAIVPGTDGRKMSKSYDNTLPLFAPEKIVSKKIMAIVTDSTPVAAPKPATHHLLSLLLLLAPAEAHDQIKTSWQEGGIGYGTYKKELLGYFLHFFQQARQERERLIHDRGYVAEQLALGAERAKRLAQPIWHAVQTAVGCGPAGN